jgi:hypothetical protein
MHGRLRLRTACGACCGGRIFRGVFGALRALADARWRARQAREPDAEKAQIPALVAALAGGGAGPEVARAVRCARTHAPRSFGLHAGAGGKSALARAR